MARAPVKPVQLFSKPLLVEEQNCGKRLILGRRSNIAQGNQTVEEGCDFRLPHFARMAYPVEVDEALDPVHIALLGPVALVPAADRAADLVKQAGLAAGCGAFGKCLFLHHKWFPRFNRNFYTAFPPNALIVLNDDNVTRAMPICKSAFNPTTSR